MAREGGRNRFDVQRDGIRIHLLPLKNRTIDRTRYAMVEIMKIRILAKLAIAVVLLLILMTFAQGQVDFVYTGF